MSHIPLTGAEDVRWDLTFMYKGITDPKLDADVAELERAAAEFEATFKGKLDARLGDAVESYARMVSLSSAIGVYLHLRRDEDLTDEAVKSRQDAVSRRVSETLGRRLAFFENELCELPQEAVDAQCGTNGCALKHRPWIDHLRAFRKHLLSVEVEAALAIRAPFGPGSWSDFYEETEAGLTFGVGERALTLAETLHLLSSAKDREARAAALKALDAGFAGPFEKLSAQTMNQIVGLKALEDRERGYPHPMSSRNLESRIPDAVVESLHVAVTEAAAPLTREYYRLKAKLLGLDRLAWSDRNAPMPFVDEAHVPYAEAERIAREAFRSFSPELEALVAKMIDGRRIDAAARKGKHGGAYNCSLVMPDGEVASFVLHNYLGTNRDVMTLSHELGHAVHGLLAGAAQGALMQHAPTAYAETASIFAEKTTFEFLDRRLKEGGDAKSRLALVMGKLDDVANTVVRQIGFSNFERRIHADPRRRSPEEYAEAWMETTRELYGPDGDVFTYEDATRLWCYVSHFHRPFYVYGYAFGELLTQSLYDAHASGALGDRFEPLYLDLLRSGGTKDVSALLKPFSLDPTDPAFWHRAVESGFGGLLAEAKSLAKELGLA